MLIEVSFLFLFILSVKLVLNTRYGGSSQILLCGYDGGLIIVAS
jgi:hypothetical protein